MIAPVEGARELPSPPLSQHPRHPLPDDPGPVAQPSSRPRAGDVEALGGATRIGQVQRSCPVRPRAISRAARRRLSPFSPGRCQSPSSVAPSVGSAWCPRPVCTRLATAERSRARIRPSAAIRLSSCSSIGSVIPRSASSASVRSAAATSSSSARLDPASSSPPTHGAIPPSPPRLALSSPTSRRVPCPFSPTVSQSGG